MTSASLDRRGVALAMALLAALLVASFTLVALETATVQARLVADQESRVEGQLVTSTALAEVRVAHRAELDSLGDGERLEWPVVVRVDGWSWLARAARTGAVIRLDVAATRRSAAGDVVAARRSSLLLARVTADTVRVLGSRPRF